MFRSFSHAQSEPLVGVRKCGKYSASPQPPLRTVRRSPGSIARPLTSPMKRTTVLFNVWFCGVGEGRCQEELIAQPEIQRQLGSDLPIVLNEDSPVRNHLLLTVRPAPPTVVVPAQQAVSESVAGRAATSGIVRNFCCVNPGVLETAPSEPRRRARNLGPAVLDAYLDRVAALDPK